MIMKIPFWPTSRAANRRQLRKDVIRNACKIRARRAFFETLEDRRMLATITVTSLTDGPLATLAGDGLVSLREAIEAANTDTSVDGSTAGSAADVIEFAPNLTGTILMTGGEFALSSDITINGPGVGMLTINGNQQSRVFNGQTVGATVGSVTVSLSGMTITGGRTTIPGNQTGTNDPGGDGGGIRFVSTGPLTLTETVVSGNRTEGDNADGGGIFHRGGGNLTITRSTISGNTTTGNMVRGGGIYSDGGELVIGESTISANIQTTTATADQAVVVGGGLFRSSPPSTGIFAIANSTISGNSSVTTGGAYIAESVSVILRSTITGNQSTDATKASGIVAYGTTTQLGSTIISGNIGGDFSGINLLSLNFNLVGTGDAAVFTGTGDQTAVTDAKLGPLANNGGPTQTHALLAGSLAIDKGDPASPPTTDQRGTGFSRSVDGDGNNTAVPDVGAFEFMPPDPAPMISDLADDSMLRNTSKLFGYEVTDIGTPLTALTLSVTSSNAALVPPTGISAISLVQGIAAQFTITPVADQVGTTTITFTATDPGGMTSTDTFVLTVADNTPPRFVSTFSNETILRNGVLDDIRVAAEDLTTPVARLVVSATSSNATLVPPSGIEIDQFFKLMTIAPALGQVGTATITVTVTDEGGLTDVETFMLTVSANSPPTITDIVDQVVAPATPTSPLAFTIGDAETAVGTLVVAAVSSNTTLVPPTGIVLAGTGADRTIQITPAAGQTGQTTIRVTVTDEGGTTAEETFEVKVGTAPTLTAIADLSMPSNTTTSPIAFTTADADAGGTVEVKATSSNQALVRDPDIDVDDAAAAGSIKITPVQNAVGTATITVTATDNLGLTATRTFVLTVDPVGPPSLSVLVNVFTAPETPSDLVPFKVGDVQTNANDLTVTVVSANTTLLPQSGIVLTGTGTDRALRLTPAAGQVPVVGQRLTSKVTVTVTDGAGTTATGDFDFVVESAANTAPDISDILDRSLPRNTATPLIPFTVSDDFTAAKDLIVTAVSDTPALVAASGIEITGTGMDRSIKITPVQDQVGEAKITVTVSDGTLTETSEFFVVFDDALVVTTLVDENGENPAAMSLREALAITNNPPPQTPTTQTPIVITFAPALTAAGPAKIALTHGELLIRDSVTIFGPGADLLTLDAGGTSRVIYAEGSNSFSVDLYGLTITGGRTIDPGITDDDNFGSGDEPIGGEGGGIYSEDAELLLDGVVVTGNHTTGDFAAGGGIFTRRDLTIIRSVISNNSTLGDDAVGGGIRAANTGRVGDGASKLTLLDSKIVGNRTSGEFADGGGIFSTADELIRRSTVSGNSTTGPESDGGGAHLSEFEVYDSTFSNNIVSGMMSVGGGAYSEEGTFTNSTFSGNKASGAGGGIFVFDDLALENVTVTLNEAPTGNGAGVALDQASAADGVFYNTLIAGNIGTDIDFLEEVLLDAIAFSDYNVIGTGNAVAAFNRTVDVIGVTDPKLGPLSNNGGPTETHALLIGSPAIDAGDPGAREADDADTDQRGAAFPRVVGTRIDVGAFEFDATNNTAPTISDIASQSVAVSTATPAIAFTVGDTQTAPTALTLAATSSNLALVPTTGIVLAGTDANRTLTITPTTGQTGTSTITVTVTDAAGLSVSDSFVLTVGTPNSAPTITAIADQFIGVSSSTPALAFTIGDSETAASALTVSVDSDATGFVPTSRIVVGGTGADRTLTITPGVGQSDNATITVTVTDEGGLSASSKFELTATTGNTPPSISSIADQTVAPDTTTSALPFTIGDPQSDPANLTVTATSSNTTLVPVANVVVAGTGANRTVTATPATGQTGSTTITVSVADEAGLTTTETFVLTVGSPVQTLVSVTVAPASVNEDGAGELVYTFTRTGSTAAALPVSYTVGGTATSGVDFTALPGTVTIPAGATSVTVSVNPTDDTTDESNVSIIVTVTDTTAYDVGSAASATGMIIDDDGSTPGGIAVNVSPSGPDGAPDPANLPGTSSQPTSWAQQRSSMRELTINLPAAIAAPTAADLVLTNLGVNADADTDTVITLRNDQISLSTDMMQLQITFDVGQLTDGVYKLELLAAITGGATFTLEGNSTNKFFVLTGDWNGSGAVTPADFATFAYWFGQPSANSPAYVDLRPSDSIGIGDFAPFAAGFGKSIVYPGVGASVRSSFAGEGELSTMLQSLTNPADVNGDGEVTASDALDVIHELSRNDSTDEESTDELSPVMHDANRDGKLTAADALYIINRLESTVSLIANGELDRDKQTMNSVDELLSDESFINGLF